MTFTDIHGFLGNAVVIFTALVSLWSGLHVLQKREIGGDFWGAVIIGEGLIVLQVLVGVILTLRGAMPARPIHFVYGGVSVITWPAVFAFTRGDTSRRSAVFWLVFSLFLFGVSLRAISTAG